MRHEGLDVGDTWMWARDNGSRHNRTIPKELGVTRRADMRAGGIGWLRAEISGSRYHLTQDDGVGLVVVPVFDWPEPGDLDGLIDLIGFQPSRPDRWYTLTAQAQCLGGWHADSVREQTPLWPLAGDPPPPTLRIYSTPLEWLQHGCDGMVILHPEFQSYILHRIKRVLVQKPTFGARLRSDLMTRDVPQIYVETQVQSEAA